MTVEGATVRRSSKRIVPEAHVDVERRTPDYVGRGGHKLDAALDAFEIDVTGRRALDVGASTGGFTQALLRRRAQSVVAVDVGRRQLAPELRNDTRVTLREETDIRSIGPADVSGPFALVTVDLSFISTIGLADRLAAFVGHGGDAVVLVKPQFEAGRDALDKRGVVNDPAVHRNVVERAVDGFGAAGLRVRGTVESPVTGGSGNREWLLWSTRAGSP